MSQTYYCSFCGLSQNEVEQLIAGPSVFICDKCVDLCTTIVAEKREEKAKVVRDFANKIQIPPSDLVQRLRDRSAKD